MFNNHTARDASECFSLPLLLRLCGLLSYRNTYNHCLLALSGGNCSDCPCLPGGEWRVHPASLEILFFFLTHDRRAWSLCHAETAMQNHAQVSQVRRYLPPAGEVVVFATKRLLFPSIVTHQKDDGPDVVWNSIQMLDSDQFYIKGGQELSTTRAARKTPVLVYLHKLSRSEPGTGVAWFIEGLCFS